MDNQNEEHIEEIIPEEEMPTPAIVSSKEVMASFEDHLETMEKRMILLNKAKKLAVAHTNNSDWCNQGGTPYLERKGANKVAHMFGVSVTDTEALEPEKKTDNGHPYTVFRYKGKFKFNNQILWEEGSATTKDAFFAIRKINDQPYLLPESEVDIEAVRKKAMTNMINRGIRNLLGLNFTWKELEELSNGKITRDGATSTNRSKGTQGGRNESADAGELRTKVWARIMALCGDNEAFARESLAKRTAFTLQEGPEAGKTIKGKTDISKVSEKQLKYLCKALDEAERKMKEGK